MLCEFFNVICSVVDGKNNSLKATMEQFTEKGFHSSREWLATHLQDMIGKEHSGIVIEQVLQTYDSLYHSYVLQVLATHTHTLTHSITHFKSLLPCEILIISLARQCFHPL